MRKSIKAIITIILILFIVGITALLIYFNWILKTPVSSTLSESLFEIKGGESALLVGQRLRERGFIRSEWAFYAHTKFKDGNLVKGVYEFSPSMTILEIFQVISSGETKVIKVTIPEGYRAEQTAQVLESKNLVKYNDFLAEAKKYEGKLFPDTYYFTPDDDAKKIVAEMLKDFEQRTAGLNVSSEDLVIASIVEREAVKDEERPLIAGIYKNRIKRSMKLEADPTVQYGKDTNRVAEEGDPLNYKFWQPITSKDYLSVKSPYNTYLISSLPPGPICNPGIKSIEATLNYSEHDYLYFFQANGNIYPSKTGNEHEASKKKYLY